LGHNHEEKKETTLKQKEREREMQRGLKKTTETDVKVYLCGVPDLLVLAHSEHVEYVQTRKRASFCLCGAISISTPFSHFLNV
jgi:hypothetical protein